MTLTVDLNELAEQFARGALSIDGVYRSVLKSAAFYSGHTRTNLTPRSGFVFALKGSARFEFNGTPYELSPGKVVHGGKHMELSIQVHQAGFEYGLIHYTLAEMPPVSSSYTNNHFLLETGENPNIVNLFQTLHHVSGTPGGFPAIREKELFYSLFYEVLTSTRSRINEESRNAIEHVIDYMDHFYMNPLTLASLANLCGMDVKRFSYLFNKYTGMFPIDYLIRHRMNKAKHLLAVSSCSINGIAESVGYSDAHYFSRLFKKHVGCSPSDFRAHLGNCPPGFHKSSIFNGTSF